MKINTDPVSLCSCSTTEKCQPDNHTKAFEYKPQETERIWHLLTTPEMDVRCYNFVIRNKNDINDFQITQ